LAIAVLPHDDSEEYFPAFARMRPLLDDFDAALDSINAFRDKPAGLLRITVAPPVANFMLAPLLSRFLA
jgi:DNA-binding transcriptional LysR family regulator